MSEKTRYIVVLRPTGEVKKHVTRDREVWWTFEASSESEALQNPVFTVHDRWAKRTGSEVVELYKEISQGNNILDETAQDFPITVRHKGVLLSGVIVPTKHYLTVRLITPETHAGQMDSGVNCFAAACAWNGFIRKARVEAKVTYSVRLIQKAQEYLIKQYERQERHRRDGTWEEM